MQHKKGMDADGKQSLVEVQRQEREVPQEIRMVDQMWSQGVV